jgi:hypothetical protein
MPNPFADPMYLATSTPTEIFQQRPDILIIITSMISIALIIMVTMDITDITDTITMNMDMNGKLISQINITN